MFLNLPSFLRVGKCWDRETQSLGAFNSFYVYLIPERSLYAVDKSINKLNKISVYPHIIGWMFYFFLMWMWMPFAELDIKMALDIGFESNGLGLHLPAIGMSHKSFD